MFKKVDVSTTPILARQSAPRPRRGRTAFFLRVWQRSALLRAFGEHILIVRAARAWRRALPWQGSLFNLFNILSVASDAAASGNDPFAIGKEHQSATHASNSCLRRAARCDTRRFGRASDQSSCSLPSRSFPCPTPSDGGLEARVRSTTRSSVSRSIDQSRRPGFDRSS